MSMVAMLIPRTIRHNTRTIGLYRPRKRDTKSCRGERTRRAVIHFSKRQMEGPRLCRSACPSPDLGSSVIQQEPSMRNLLLSTAAVVMAGAASAALAQSGPATEGTAAIHPDEKGNLYIDPKVFPSAVAADLPPQIAESLANHQLPLNHTAFEAPVDTAAWHDKPTFYVITARDKVIAPEVQKIFANRMKAQTTEVAGSHASLVVHAKEVAAVIEKAALVK